jgi:hypothetical protein
MVGDEGSKHGCTTGGGEFTPQSRLLTPSVYGRFLGGKWSEHENQKSEIQKSENHKSIIY